MTVDALVAELREHANNWPNRAEYYAARGADLAETAADALASERSRADRLEKALTAARTTMRNCRGAVETNQVEDKDVRRQLFRGMEAIDAALSADGGSRG